MFCLDGRRIIVHKKYGTANKGNFEQYVGQLFRCCVQIWEIK